MSDFSQWGDCVGIDCVADSFVQGRFGGQHEVVAGCLVGVLNDVPHRGTRGGTSRQQGIGLHLITAGWHVLNFSQNLFPSAVQIMKEFGLNKRRGKNS